MFPKTYFIKTFGCAMNVSDSERVSAFLEKQGFEEAKKIEQADVVVFNTCGIRQAAENRAYGLINNLKENCPEVKIILTGCLANRSDVQKRLKGKVDLFFSIHNFKAFENWITRLASTSDSSCESRRVENSFEIHNSKFIIPEQMNITHEENIHYLSINPKYSNGFEAFVPVMTGCNNFCSYCVVPYARGSEVSRPAEEILSEIKTLISKGFKQITLLGQNVNSYADGKNTFSILLKKINVIPGKFWITFISSHPKDMSDELIETIAKCKKVCEWIHLPIQAGDDEILKKMNRKYTQKHYLNKIKKIRKTFAQIRGQLVPISVSTDIIVGFPGETRKQFLQSAAVMEKAEFDMAYFGQFSPRPGTVAWNMKDNVPKTEKARREKVLNEILKKTALANNKKYVGTTQEVLIEKAKVMEVGSPKGGSTSQQRAHVYFGKTRTQKNVKITSPKKIPTGIFAKAKITKANIWNLEGVLK